MRFGLAHFSFSDSNAWRGDDGGGDGGMLRVCGLVWRTFLFRILMHGGRGGMMGDGEELRSGLAYFSSSDASAWRGGDGGGDGGMMGVTWVAT